MRKLRNILILGVLLIINMIGTVGCNSTIKSEIGFDLEEFENEIKSKGYEYKRQDLQGGILTPISQYMHLNDSIMVDDKQVILYDTEIIIYSYEYKEEMEKEASFINEEASEINRNDDFIQIEWPKTPHFYKKGRIIVQYIGDDEKIISDLTEIMGEQFAGM